MLLNSEEQGAQLDNMVEYESWYVKLTLHIVLSY